MEESAGAAWRAVGWSAAACTVFLDTLALSGDVAHSAEAAGQSYASAYALRRHDPVFAEGWEAALDAAYARLADELLVRAIDVSARGVGTVDQALALKMLARHDTRRARPNTPREPMPPMASSAEIEQSLLRKLEAFGKRVPAQT